MEIFVTLGSGHTLCSAERHLTLENVNRTVRDLGATVMMATPSMATLIDPDKIPTLRSLWTMGETLSDKLIDTFASHVDDGLINAYGPTEASINCTLLQVPHGYRGSILGSPLPTCSLYLVDPDSQVIKLVPAGLAGELCIGGPQLSIGYRNRAQETAAAFINHPMLGRIYRTGDRARFVWNENGKKVVEILGRIKSDQVKISGRRVELGEVDAVIGAVEGIRQCVTVLCQPHGQEQLRLVVLIVPESEAYEERVLQEACRERAEKHLSSFLRPHRILPSSSIPRNASGKVDRSASRALAERILSNAQSMNATACAPQATNSASVSPEQGALEGILVRCLAQSVGLAEENLCSTTAFSDVGLSSLAAMHFLQGTQQMMPSECPPVTLAHLMDSDASVRTIAAAVLLEKTGESRRGPGTPFSPYLEPEKKLELEAATNLRFEKCLHVTATQAGILSSHCRSSTGSRQKTYIHQKGYPLRKHTDPDRFSSALDAVLRRHEVFRTVFIAVDDTTSPFAQCVLDQKDDLPELSLERVRCGEDQDFSDLQRRILARHAQDITIDRPCLRASLVYQGDRAVLLVSIVHAIFDGGSLKLIEDDLEREYDGQAAQPRQGISLSVQRYLSLTSQVAAEKTRKYWDNELAGAELDAFPCISGEKTQSDSGECLTVERISQVCTLQGLEKAALNAGVPVLSFVQLAWTLMLTMLSESKRRDVIFGSVVSNRLDSDSQQCIAPTFTTIPVRVQLGQDGCTLRTALQQLADHARASLPHTHTALGSIRTETGTLPYDTLLALQVFAGSEQANVLWDDPFYPPMHNDFAIMMEIWPTEAGPLRLKATCKRTISNEESATTLLAQFDHLLAGIMKSDLEQEVGEASHLSLPQALLSTLDRPSEWPNPTLLLHEHFEQHARTSPDHPALAFSLPDPLHEGAWQTKSLTYAQLNERADAFATLLVQANGGWLQDEPVPLCIVQSVELYIAILGILKAGGAWCPIDPGFPVQRQRRLIQRTGAKLLVLQEGCSGIDMIADLAISVVFVTERPVSKQLDDSRRRRPALSDLAYLIWTSGSTGEPKGVLIEHQAASTAMKALQDTIPADSPPRTLQFSAFTFDIHIQDIFYTWGLGGCVVAASRRDMIEHMPTIVAANGVTHAHLTPAFGATISRTTCPSLRVVTMIGEKLTEDVASNWSRDVLFFNTYGPAENTVVSTVRQISDCEGLKKASNIGWPLPSVSLAVVRGGVPVPRGGVGELALAGPHLARGYLQDEAKTSSQFIFNHSLGQRIYLTGDMVRMLHDGSLDFLGRTDDMIKINGVRIELSEISRTMMGCHEHVSNIETLYLSRPDRPQRVLVCFLCADQAAEGDSHSMNITQDKRQEQIVRGARRLAHDCLPTYMRPVCYIIVKEIPRSPSAKVDTKKLTELYLAASLEDSADGSNDTAVASLIPLEGSSRIVADCISEILEVPVASVACTQNLASLGLDSIRCIRLSASLKKKGLHASAFDLMQLQTLEGICRKVRESHLSKVSPRQQHYLNEFQKRYLAVSSAQLDGRSLQYVAPVSPLQESLLLETSVHGEAYWSTHLFHLQNGVDLQRLQNAWDHVAQETEILRASFLPMAEIDPKGRGFMQCVYRQATVDWREAKVPIGGVSNAVRAFVSEVSQARAPSWSGQLGWALAIFHDVATSAKTMALVMHHALYDQTALQHLLHHVRQVYLAVLRPAYTQLSTALKLGLAPSRVQQDEAASYWKTLLSSQVDASQMWSLPDLAGPRKSAKDTGQMNTTRFELSMDKQTMSAYAQNLDMNSCAPLVQAAFGAILSDYIAQDAILVGSTISERSFYPELENAIAPLISTFPFLIKRTGTCGDFFKSLAKQWRQSPKHRHISGNTIRKALSWPPDRPLYPAFFVFHPEAEVLQTSAGDCELWAREEKDSMPLKVDHAIALNLYDGDKMVMALSVADTVMSLSHVELFAKQIDAQLTAMLQHLDTPLTALAAHLPCNLLSTSLPTSSATNIHPYYWVQSHAEQHPDWLAVEEVRQDFSVHSWTYKQLDCRVRQCAKLLLSHVHQPDPVIAVCMGRTLESFAAILSIFFVGGVYLPIAEDLPVERKKFLVQDSAASVILASHDLAEPFEELSVTILAMDSPEALSSLETAIDTTNECGDHGGGYLLYTSGSTGTPKGVRATSRNLSCFVEGYASLILRHSARTGQLGGRGKQLNLASRAFDPHLSQMFVSWRLGLCATTGPRMLLLDDLRRTINTLGITHMGILPSMLDQSGLLPVDVPSLAMLSVGGEKMSAHVIETWASSSEVTIFNLYGPTETTIGCTLSLVTPFSSPRNIGYPIGNSSALVVEPGTLNVVKLGQKGELCIAGDLVTKGYLRPVPSTGFCTLPDGTPAYRTGDMVQMMANRSLEFLGRNDEQIKIRGQRLELSEVTECVLSAGVSSPIVAATAYFRHPQQPTARLFTFYSDKSQGSSLHNFQVSAIEGGVLAEQIARHCGEQLPAFMVPLLVRMEALPLLPSGKIDLKRIVKAFSASKFFDQHASSSRKEPDASQGRALNSAESQVVELVKEVAGSASLATVIHEETSIFELGVDSLNAVNLSFRLRNFGYQASVAQLMSADTIGQIAKLPKMNEQRKKPEPAINLDTFDAINMGYLAKMTNTRMEAVEAVLPALPLQQGLVAMSIGQSWQGDFSFYMHHAAYRMDGKSASVASVVEAWHHVAAREQILRTSFAEGSSGEIVQVVHHKHCLPDLITSKQANVEEAYQCWRDERTALSQTIIDGIDSTPPYRVQILGPTLEGPASMMLISMHHSLYDAESFEMLLDDTSQFIRGGTPALRPQSKLFLEVIAQQDQDDAQRFWKQYLQGFVPGRVTDDKKPSAAGRFSFSVSDTAYAVLKEAAQQYKVTLSVLCQVVFALVIARKTQRLDVVFGNVMSGRNIPVDDIDSMMIPCLTTMPLRISMQGLHDVEEVARVAKESAANVWPYQHTSLAKIQRWVECEQALFDCLFSFRLVRRRENDNRSAALFHQIDSSHATGYPLALEIEADEDQQTLRATLACSGLGLDPDVVNALGEQLRLMLTTHVGQAEGATLSMLGLPRTDATQNQTRSTESYGEDAWEPEERIMQRVLAQSLHMPSDGIAIGRGTSFYSIGLDSILAIRYTRLLREEGLHTSTAEILQAKCIAGLWQAIKPKNRPSSEETDEGMWKLKERHSHLFTSLGERDELEAIYRCTPLQNGMLSGSMMSKTSAYDQTHEIRLRRGVDLDRLKSAWISVIQRHDILRSTFHLTEDVACPWVALVHSRPAIRWEEVQVVSPPSEPGFEVPPVRVGVNGDAVTFHIHHSLYDGNSLPMIFGSLRQAYSEADAEVSLNPPIPFYKIASHILQNQKESDTFWTGVTSGYEYATLPFANVQESTNVRRWRASRKLAKGTKQLDAECRDVGVSLQSVSLLAFAKVLATVLERRDICFGQVISGRSLSIPGVSEIIGPLFNTIPFRVTLDSAMESNVEAVQKVQDLSEKSHAHQCCSLRSVQNTWRKQGGRAKRMIDCLFLYQRKEPALPRENALWDALRGPEDPPEDEEKDDEYDLNFNLVSAADTVTISINGSAKVVAEQGQLDSFLDTFEAALCDILAAPQRPALSHPAGISRVPLRSNVSHDGAAGQARPCRGGEVVLQQELSKMLSIPEMTIDSSTNIFLAGIDSISAIRLSHTCRERGLEIGAMDIIQGQTIQEACRLARSAKVGDWGNNDQLETLVPAHQKAQALKVLDVGVEQVQAVLPCLAGQLHHADAWVASGHRFYEAPWVYRMQNVDETRLQQAWQELCQRHDVLRTTLVGVEQSILQVVLHSHACPAPWQHRRVSADRSLEEAAREYVVESNSCPSNLFSPPVRICLLQKDGEAAVVLRLHHALYDAHSIGQLIQDLGQLYKGETLPSLPTFSSFVCHAAQQDMALQEGRWKRHLREAQVTTIARSIATQRSDDQVAQGPQLLVRMPNILRGVDRLKQSCRMHGVTLQHVVMLAFAKVLASRTTATRKPVFGFYSSNRSSDFPNIDKLPGPTLNVLPIAVSLDQQTNRAALANVSSELRERTGCEQTSLQSIAKWINGGEQPLFNCYLNLLWHHPSSRQSEPSQRPLQPWRDLGDTGYFTLQPASPGLQTTLVSVKTDSYLAKNGFYVDLGLHDDSFHIGIRCSALEHDAVFVETFAQDFVQTIQDTVSLVG